MGDYGVLIGWDRVAVGRERLAMEVWANALDYYEKAVANGDIEGYRTFGFQGNNLNLLGCILIEGSRDQIDRLVETQDFIALQQQASMVVDRLTMTRCQSGQPMADTVGMFMKQIDALGV